MIELADGQLKKEEVTVSCPECDSELRIEMDADIEITDHCPDGIIEATCGECRRAFAVGFQRKREAPVESR